MATSEMDYVAAELRRRGVDPDTGQPAAAAGSPNLAAVDAELRRRGIDPETGQPLTQVPAPPGGVVTAPVLPPVTPGSVAPPTVGPGTPPPAPAPPPEDTSHIMGAPGGPAITPQEQLWGNPLLTDVTPDLTPQGPYTNQARAEGLQQARQQTFKELVQPSGKPTHPPAQFTTSPLERELFGLNLRLDALHRQLGPQHTPAIGGPVDVLKRQQATVAAQLYHQVGDNFTGPLGQAVVKAMDQYNKDDAAITSRLNLWQNGKLNSRQAAQLSQDMHDHEANRQAVLHRRASLIHYANTAAQAVRQYQGQGLNYGAYLPEEIAARQGGSTVGEFGGRLAQPENYGLLAGPASLVKRGLDWANKNINPAGNTLEAIRQVDTARQELMLEGKYPGLPPNPGHTPQERAYYDGQTRAIRDLFFHFGMNGELELARAHKNRQAAGFIPGPFDKGFDSYLNHQPLTPWQQTLIPVLKAQAQAENEALRRAKVGQAAAKDVGLFALAEAGGQYVGVPLLGKFGKLLSPLEARLEASTLNPLVRTGAKFGLRTGAAATAHGAGAAVAGGTGAGTLAAMQGEPWRRVLSEVRSGALQTAGIGAVMGAGGHLLSPRATVRTPASEFYHNPSLAKPKTNDFITLPDGAQFNLATASREELNHLHDNLPADDPSRVLVEQRLFGPPGSHRLSEVTGRQHAARDLTSHDIQGILQDYTTAEQQGPLTPAQQMNKAAVEQHAGLQNAHAETQRPELLRPEAAQEQRTGFAKAKVLGQNHARTLDAAAGSLQGPKPGIAQVLREASSEIRRDFQTDYRQNDEVNTGTRATREANLPQPRRSAWRRLTPAERAALPENVRRILILQDIHNSGTVVEPGVSPRSFVADLGKRSTSWLAGEADRRFDQAESEFARGRQSAADVTLQQPSTTGERLQQAQGQHGAAQGQLTNALTQPGAPETGAAQSQVQQTRQAVIDANRAHAEATASELQGRYVDSLTKHGADAPETMDVLDEYRQARDRAEALKKPVEVPLVPPPATVEQPALETRQAARQQKRGRRSSSQQKQPLKKTAAPTPTPAPAAGPNPVLGFPKEKLQANQAIQKVDAEGHPLGPRERIVKADNRTVTYTDSTAGNEVTQRLDKFMKSPFVPIEEGPIEGRKGGSAGSQEEGRIPGGKTVAPELHEKAAAAERRTARQVHYLMEEAKQKLTVIGDALGFVRHSDERTRLLAEAYSLRADSQQAIRQEQTIGLAGAMKLRDRARALDDQLNPALTAKQRFLRELEQVSPEQAGYAGPDKSARAPQTLTARLNTAAIQDARTGEPLQITGFRSEAKGGRIPGSGVFYSPYPQQAVDYSKRYGPEQSVKELTVDALKFENPLVIGKSDAYDPNQHGHAEFGQYLWNRTREDPSLKPIAAAWVGAYKNLAKHGWRGYAMLDKAMAVAARAAGHDAIILRNDVASEIVDLRSRQPGTDVNGRPIRQPEATPGSAVSDWQHWGTNFPAGWEMNREKPVLNPEGEVGRKGGQKETGAANQMIDDAVDDPQVAATFHRARGMPDETPKDMKTASINAGKTTLESTKHFLANFRNTIPDLVAREHPELHRMLLARIEGVANAMDKAARLVDGAVKHLTPDERKLWEFRRWITDLSATSDKQWDAHQKNGGTAADFKAALPDGITRDWVKNTEKKLARNLLQKSQQNDIDIQKLEAADNAVSRYRNAIVPHFDALYKQVNGVDLKLRDNIEHYMRHQVLFLDNVLGGGAGASHRIDASPRASHMQGRSLAGTDLVHNTNWVEAEMDWLPKMVRQIADLEIMKHLSDNYDIAPQMRLAHAEINAPGMIAALQGHVAGTKLPQAHLDVLARMAAEHHLPDKLDGRFKGLLDSLLQLHSDNTRLQAANQPVLHLSPEMSQRLGEYADFLLESKNGKVSAKSIVDDPSWKQKNKVQDWQPIEGRHFYQAMTVPEKMIQQALSGVDVYLDPETLRGVKAIGAKRRTMVLPEKLAQVMEGYVPEEYKNQRNVIQKVIDPVLTLWKWDKLYNPVHAGIYFLNNARSDYDAVFRGHTRAAGLIGIGKTAIELGKYMQTGDAGPLLTEWLDRGGLSSTFVHQVGMAPRGLNVLAKYGTSEVPRWKRNLTWAGNKYHNLMTMPHELREATLRYHNFKVWTAEMEANGGVPQSFGASDPQVVMGIKDLHDRAWELSNDLLGAYNKTSVGGQFFRKNFFPFWSWQEVLVHREVQLAKNALFAPRIAAELGHQMTGGQATGVMAMAIGRYLAGLAAYGATTEMLNRVRFGANYRKLLPKELRGRTEPVMIWRHDPESGQLLYLDKPTNFFDFADWFHLNRIPQYVEAVRKGQMQPHEVALDMLQGPRERLTQQLGPQFKLPAELSYQMADFPDPSRPHKVGPLEAIMREVSLDKALKMVQGLPMPPPGKVRFFGHEFGGRTPLWTGPLAGQDMVHMVNTGVLDLGDTNYFEARADAQQWKARKLNASGLPGSETDEMHEAAYNFRKALRYGDRRSADQFLWVYAKLGGTDKSLKQSLMDMEPLHGLKPSEEARYLEQLAPDDRERLRSAYLHWANIVAPHTIGPDDWDKPLKGFLLTARSKVMQHLRAEWGTSKKTGMGLKIDLGKSMDPAIERVQKLDPDARETYLKGLSAEGAGNLKQKYTDFAGRAGVPDFAVPPRLSLPDWIEAAQRQIRSYRIKVRTEANKEDRYRGNGTELEQSEDLVPTQKQGE